VAESVFDMMAYEAPLTFDCVTCFFHTLLCRNGGLIDCAILQKNANFYRALGVL